MVWMNGMFDQAAGAAERNLARAAVSDGEARLVEAAQSGDLSAFNRLVLAYQDDLFGWVVSLVDDDELAQDITQMTFVTAYQKLHTFRGGSLRAWLFRIARNRSFDHARARRRHPTVSLDDSRDGEAADLLSILPAPDALPEEAVIQAEQAERLGALMERLPEPFRRALQLVDVYEMDYREAAAVLRVPAGTLKSRLVRARLKLRQMVEQSPGAW